MLKALKKSVEHEQDLVTRISKENAIDLTELFLKEVYVNYGVRPDELEFIAAKILLDFFAEMRDFDSAAYCLVGLNHIRIELCRAAHQLLSND